MSDLMVLIASEIWRAEPNPVGAGCAVAARMIVVLGAPGSSPCGSTWPLLPGQATVPQLRQR